MREGLYWQVAIPDNKLRKSQIRAEMKNRLRCHANDSSGVVSRVLQWLAERPEVKMVAAYHSLFGEPNLAELFNSRTDLLWVFPRVSAENLTFHHSSKNPGALIVGSFGTREPAVDSPMAILTEIDAFLCPGLAFDLNRNRLGRGRGFYDRTLSRANPQAQKVGICFPFQRVEDVFPESHDVAMDCVIDG